MSRKVVITIADRHEIDGEPEEAYGSDDMDDDYSEEEE